MQSYSDCKTLSRGTAEKKDLSASVRQKLANIAKANGMFFQEILQRRVNGHLKTGGKVIKLLKG
jgi:hypothetical protein